MIRKIYKNLAFLVAALGNYLVFLPLFSLFKTRYPCYADPAADICVEGFPRSGNSFFVAVLQQWNPKTIIAHHTHLASNAKYYANRDKPTVILIREPAEAIASAIAWDGKDALIVPAVGLISYLGFYRSLKKFREKILFLDFKEAVNQPDKCIEKINSYFSREFCVKEFTLEENQSVQHLLTRHDRHVNRSELSSSLPNEKKSELKTTIIPKITSHALFARAQTVYQEFKALAINTPYR